MGRENFAPHDQRPSPQPPKAWRIWGRDYTGDQNIIAIPIIPVSSPSPAGQRRQRPSSSCPPRWITVFNFFFSFSFPEAFFAKKRNQEGKKRKLFFFHRAVYLLKVQMPACRQGMPGVDFCWWHFQAFKLKPLLFTSSLLMFGASYLIFHPQFCLWFLYCECILSKIFFLLYLPEFKGPSHKFFFSVPRPIINLSLNINLPGFFQICPITAVSVFFFAFTCPMQNGDAIKKEGGGDHFSLQPATNTSSALMAAFID